MTNFTFGKGVEFHSDERVAHIIPALIDRILTVDNKKQPLLWSIGNLGSVSGDAFVKIAYDPPWVNGIGEPKPGRVRLLALNPAFCLTPDTEVLTRRGWLTYDQLTTDDQVLSIDPETDENTWTSVEGINVFDWDGPMANWENERFSVMSTPDHRWLYESGRGKRSVKQTRELHNTAHGGAKLLVAGGTPVGFSDIAKWDDDVVEAIAWFVTEGHWHPGTGVPMFTQDEQINPEYAARIDRISRKFGGSKYSYHGKAEQWYVRGLKDALWNITGKDKRLTPEFLCSLTYAQARLLYETLIDADGHRGVTTTWSQSHEGRVADFQMLTMMLGLRTQAHWRQRDTGKPCCDVTIYKNRSVYLSKLNRSEAHYAGKVWCPTTGNSTWVARRKGITFVTGNCFPEWAPHDMERLLRFKLKYRFWACYDLDMEALTRRGWMKYDQIRPDDEILTLNPWTDEIEWQQIRKVHVMDYSGPMHRWTGRVEAFTTPNHRWLAEVGHGRAHTYRREREIVRSGMRPSDCRLITGGGTPLEFADQAKWTDELVETVAWYVTEGCDHYNQTGFHTIKLAQNPQVNPEKAARIRRLMHYWRTEGCTFNEWKPKKDGLVEWYLGKGINQVLEEVAPGKQITPEFLCSLTFTQAQLFYNTLLDGDGYRVKGKNSVRWTQIDENRKDGFQMLLAMLGKRSKKTSCGEKIQEYQHRYSSSRDLNEEVEEYDGQVWCPEVPNSIFMCRYNGTTYWTGNTAPEGTRQVYTYTEIITDDVIEEYVNDQLIRQNPNPLGEIPVVHIANMPAASSPWGLSDIVDVVSLNRQYNETATDIQDIINYHCLDQETQALTQNGWKYFSELSDNDEILTLNPETDVIEWQPAQVNVFPYDGELVRWNNHIDALTTPNHRWLAERKRGRPENRSYTREIARTAVPEDGDVAVPDLTGKIVVGGGTPAEFSSDQKWSDELVETVGWYLTEGCDVYSPSGWHSVSIGQKKEPFVSDIRRLAEYWKAQGGTFTESKRPNNSGTTMWYLGKGVKEALESAAPGKRLTPGFICSLTYRQAELLRKILIDGDGTRSGSRTTWYQDDEGRRDGYQMLCAMLGIRTRKTDVTVQEYQQRALDAQSTAASAETVVSPGIVWCPTVDNGIWFARRNGSTYWTGNTAPVTVVTGAKTSNLEQGPNKLWGILQKDAKVYNLEGGTEGINGALEFLDRIKQAMFEMVNIPVTALGQEQAISNTSGVALAIQFFPLMMMYSLKTMCYGEGWKQIIYYALKTLFLKEPETMFFNPDTAGIIIDPEVQLPQVDPLDPVTYQIDVSFPPPLPVDIVIKLNEIMMKMQLGLESKKGALIDLGNEFPDEKLQELFEEQIRDAKYEGAKRLVTTGIDAGIMTATGMVPGGPDEGSEPAPGPGQQKNADGSTSPAPAPPPPPAIAGMGDLGKLANAAAGDTLNELVTLAYGTKIPQARNIDKNSANGSI